MERKLEQLERRGWEALSGPEGAKFYGEVMADDGVMVFPFGMTIDKTETLRAIAGERPWARFHLSDVRVLAAGRDAAVITYRATAERDGEPPYRALMTSMYARRDGEWRLILHQQTPF